MGTKKEHKEYKGLWIEEYVSLNTNLKAHEKLLLSDIIVLYESTGKCFKSNDAFAVLISTSKRQVKRYIKSLQNKGYLNKASQIYDSPIHTSKRYLVPDIKFAKEEYIKLKGDTLGNSKGHKRSRGVTNMVRGGVINVPHREHIENNRKHIENNTEKELNIESKSISNLLVFSNEEEISREVSSDMFDNLTGTNKATKWEESKIHPYEPTGDEFDQYDYNEETKTGFHNGKKYKGDRIEKGSKVTITNQSGEYNQSKELKRISAAMK